MQWEVIKSDGAPLETIYALTGFAEDDAGKPDGEYLVRYHGQLQWGDASDLPQLYQNARQIVIGTGFKLRLVRFVRAEVVEEDYGTR